MKYRIYIHHAIIPLMLFAIIVFQCSKGGSTPHIIGLEKNKKAKKTYSFMIIGKVVDSKTKKPVDNIEVSYETMKFNTEKGLYRLKITEQSNKPPFRINLQVKDVDGMDNGGLYKSKSIEVVLINKKDGFITQKLSPIKQNINIERIK